LTSNAAIKFLLLLILTLLSPAFFPRIDI
jgi:hypothetical protein